MQYYYIDSSTDRKVIGRKYPQCNAYPYELGYNWSYAELPNSMTKIPFDKFSELKPLIVFELEKSSKLTDLLSNVTIHANGLLISERTKVIFDENLNIPNSKYYEAQIYFKGQLYKYYFLHIISLDLDLININKSTFALYEMFFDDKFIKDIEFDNKEEMQNYNKNIKSQEFIIFKNLSTKDNSVDLFHIKEICQFKRFIVTNKVLDIINENKITGFEIIPIE